MPDADKRLDYTGDGNADLTVYNKSNAAAYFGTGDGDGTFAFASLFWSPGYDYVNPEDVNGDGLSNGNGTFSYTYQYRGIGKILAK
jgi:hypothetical protein